MSDLLGIELSHYLLSLPIIAFYVRKLIVWYEILLHITIYNNWRKCWIKQTMECFLKKMPSCDIRNWERKWDSLGTLRAVVKEIENVGCELILYYISRGTMGCRFSAEPPWSIYSKMAKSHYWAGQSFHFQQRKIKTAFGDCSHTDIVSSVFPSQCYRIVRVSSVPHPCIRKLWTVRNTYCLN